MQNRGGRAGVGSSIGDTTSGNADYSHGQGQGQQGGNVYGGGYGGGGGGGNTDPGDMDFKNTSMYGVDDDDSNDPPLLEELGIHFDHIW